MKRVLSIRDLQISFKTANGMVNAIRGIKLDLFKGETLAIVGESGSGKSVTTKAILGILSENGVIDSGSITFTYDRGDETITRDLTTLSKKQMQKHIRGKRIAMVFQDPMTSLNPTMTIGQQIIEGMQEHYKIPKKEAQQKAIQLLDLVGITNPQKRYKQYPHQLSGGMRQRVVIAIALACEPEILICDEPTTALDVTIQARILQLLKQIQRKTNVSIIFITHDLGVVANMADYVAVMYAGRIIEKGSVDEIFYNPRHPYTWGLLSSIPDLEADEDELYTIPGTPPNLLHPVSGDAFAPRNAYALNIDYAKEPPLFDVGGNHRVASWLAHEDAPEVQMPSSLKKRIENMK